MQKEATGGTHFLGQTSRTGGQKLWAPVIRALSKNKCTEQPVSLHLTQERALLEPWNKLVMKCLQTLVEIKIKREGTVK